MTFSLLRLSNFNPAPQVSVRVPDFLPTDKLTEPVREILGKLDEIRKELRDKSNERDALTEQIVQLSSRQREYVTVLEALGLRVECSLFFDHPMVWRKDNPDDEQQAEPENEPEPSNIIYNDMIVARAAELAKKAGNERDYPHYLIEARQQLENEIEANKKKDDLA